VSGGGGIQRTWDVAEPLCLYPASEQATDFPAGGEALIVVAQLGRDGEPGAWATLSMEIPT
jgi:hypothetical protein